MCICIDNTVIINCLFSSFTFLVSSGWFHFFIHLTDFEAIKLEKAENSDTVNCHTLKNLETLEKQRGKRKTLKLSYEQVAAFCQKNINPLKCSQREYCDAKDMLTFTFRYQMIYKLNCTHVILSIESDQNITFRNINFETSGPVQGSENWLTPVETVLFWGLFY
jgi:hypothetical protein